MEEVKEFINADLAKLSEEQHGKLFDAPKPANDNFIDNLEWALLYLNGNKTASPIRYSEVEEHCFNLNTFDGAWLINVDRVGGSGDDIKFFRPLTSLQPTIDMFPNLNIKILNFGTPVKGGDEKSLIYLRKMRLMESKETRHLKNMKYVFEDRMAFVSNDHKWYTWGQYRCCLPKKMEVNGNIVDVHHPIPISYNPNYVIQEKHIRDYIKTDEYLEEVNHLNMFISMKMTAYYEWFVYIKEDEKSLGIKIPVSPENTKEVFALRDLPEGQVRKKAICHFVKEHYRNISTKSDYDEEKRTTLIKQHLRGETKFNWRGLQVNVIPAEYDLNRIKSKKKFLNV